MTNTPSEPDVNDPESQAVVQRVRRFSVISSVIMLAGVGTVLAVIGYRLMSTPGPGSMITGTIQPEGRVTSAIAADGRLTVTYDRDGNPLIVVYDLRTLKETHRVSVGGPQVPRP